MSERSKKGVRQVSVIPIVGLSVFVLGLILFIANLVTSPNISNSKGSLTNFPRNNHFIILDDQRLPGVQVAFGPITLQEYSGNRYRGKSTSIFVANARIVSIPGSALSILFVLTGSSVCVLWVGYRIIFLRSICSRK